MVAEQGALRNVGSRNDQARRRDLQSPPRRHVGWTWTRCTVVYRANRRSGRRTEGPQSLRQLVLLDGRFLLELRHGPQLRLIELVRHLEAGFLGDLTVNGVQANGRTCCMSEST